MRKIPDISYGNDEMQKLDLWLPDSDEFDIFIYLHGGGLVSGSRRMKEIIPEYELYSILGSGDYYNVLAALDYNYSDDEVVKYKALSMGVDKKYIDSYLNAKKRG